MSFDINQVVLDGFTHGDFIFTMLVSGSIADSDVGKAVSLDTATAGTVKLAADDDIIYGRIFQVEDRSQEGVTTVSVETRFRKRIPFLTGGTDPVIGDSVIGAGSGLVKPATTADPIDNRVLYVGADYAIVEK